MTWSSDTDAEVTEEKLKQWQAEAVQAATTEHVNRYRRHIVKRAQELLKERIQAEGVLSEQELQKFP